jgi:hypothetical protein
MTRAHGQSSRSTLNREYPHQVLVLADNIGGSTFNRALAFHKQADVPIQNYEARKDDKWYLLFCFAERKNALAFQLAFGGELLDRRNDNHH